MDDLERERRERAGRGDREAIGRLVERQRPRVRAAWLATIARNVAIDWRHKRERERERASGCDPETIEEPSNGVAGRVATGDDHAALAGLSSEALALLRLRYGEGLDGREIATRLGLTYEAVKKRLQPARAAPPVAAQSTRFSPMSRGCARASRKRRGRFDRGGGRSRAPGSRRSPLRCSRRSSCGTVRVRPSSRGPARPRKCAKGSRSRRGTVRPPTCASWTGASWKWAPTAPCASAPDGRSASRPS